VYHQMFVTVGGSSGGMEYPGIVFMGRGLAGGIMSKNTAAVIIHEIGHNWFPMMLNSNEVEYAFQDEGFNTFFTNLAMEDLYGRENNRFAIDNWLKKYIPNSDIRTEDYAEVISYQLTGYDEPILTHSDRYEQTFAYFPNSYSKTSMVLFMLQYVMGENAFSELWREYYTRFLFQKIYPEDFFNLADEIYQKYNGRKSLRWFFDQWFYKDYKLDLALVKCKYENKDGKYLTKVGVVNNERAVMPCDVMIYLDNGEKTTLWFDVDDFTKGSKYVSKTILLDAKPIKAEINPDKRLLDINRLNNTSGFLPEIYFGLKPLVELNQYPFHYKVFFYPTLWFNNVDKFKVGLGLQGKYLKDQKFFDFNISTGIKFTNSSLAGEFTLGDKLNFLGPLAYGSIKYFNLEGRRGAKIKLDKEFERYYNRNPKFIVSISANYFDAFDEKYFDPDKYMIRTQQITSSGPFTIEQIDELIDRKFLFMNLDFSYQNNWEFFRTKFNVNYQTGVVRRLEKQTIHYNYYYWLTTSENYSNFQFQKLSFSFSQDFRPKDFVSSIKFRQFIGLTPNKLPRATEFYLATVNPIEEFDLPLYRTTGIIGRNFRQNHSIPNGGGFMRGYFKNNLSDDLITVLNAQINFGKTFTYLGTIGKVIGFFNPSFFFDYGNVWANEKEINFKAFKYDWGISLSLIPEFDTQVERALNQINPFAGLGIQDVRFDFPLYVSHPPAGENKFKFRWLISFRNEL
ncbi:MAG: M1 family aminopeptidase, partial [Ignavibacteria bacterium]